MQWSMGGGVVLGMRMCSILSTSTDRDQSQDLWSGLVHTTQRRRRQLTHGGGAHAERPIPQMCTGSHRRRAWWWVGLDVAFRRERMHCRAGRSREVASGVRDRTPECTGTIRTLDTPGRVIRVWGNLANVGHGHRIDCA